MSKVITFSRTFPKTHYKTKHPTYFVEQMLQSLDVQYRHDSYLSKLLELNKTNKRISKEEITSFFYSLCHLQGKKHHTIRGGERFQKGEFFSPRVWSGVPYDSPQIIFWDDIEIKSTWKFEMDLNGVYSINGKYIDSADDEIGYGHTETLLAKNDGFKKTEDMYRWFMPNPKKPKEFSGQIICWNDIVSY